MTTEKTCTGCGSVYELTFHKLPVRDQDKINCEICGALLHKWSEAKAWDAKLIKAVNPAKPD